jgi:hypothetical protein
VCGIDRENTTLLFSVLAIQGCTAIYLDQQLPYLELLPFHRWLALRDGNHIQQTRCAHGSGLLVALHMIDEAVQRILDGSIVVYDSQSASLIEK